MCIHRSVDPEAFGSVLGMLTCPNPKFMFSKRRGDALIDRSRSVEASRFLFDKNYEVLLFLDDDIVFDPADAVKLVRAVHDNGLDVVGGNYMIKADTGNRISTKLLVEAKEVLMGTEGGIQEVRAVSTGFMAISRKAVEKVAATLPLCWMGDDLSFYPMFQPYPKEINGKWLYLSEDWAFTERCRDLGMKIWCDFSIKLRHAGRYVWDWDDLGREPKTVKDNFIYRENIPG